jgi:hypothetical protein
MELFLMSNSFRLIRSITCKKNILHTLVKQVSIWTWMYPCRRVSGHTCMAPSCFVFSPYLPLTS